MGSEVGLFLGDGGAPSFALLSRAAAVCGGARRVACLASWARGLRDAAGGAWAERGRRARGVAWGSGEQ
jgi:hypothetical protein